VATQTQEAKLTPKTIHCVKTGWPLITLVGNIATMIAQLNKLIEDKIVIAGVSAGRLFLSPDYVAQHCNANGLAKPKQLFWGTYGKAGWRQGPGQSVGIHNEAVLEEAGYHADPATLTKGKTSTRSYGLHFAKPEPKAKPAPVQPKAPMFGLPSPKAVSKAVDPLPKGPGAVSSPLQGQSLSLQPTAEELNYGRGAFGKFRGRATMLGYNLDAIQKAWHDAKAAPKKAKLSDNPIEHVTIAKQAPKPAPIAKPAPVAKAEPKATVIKVPASALQALLASVANVEITGFDAESNTFTVTA